MADRQDQIQRLRKRHTAAPDSKAFAPLADLLRRDGQFEEALVLLEDGLARYPDYLSAMVILGQTLLDARRMDHARKVLVRVLDLDPENFVALRLLSEDAVGHELWHLTLPWLEKLVVIEPQEQRWALWLEQARSQTATDGVAKNDPVSQRADGFATMSMVDIYLDQGYLTKALAALRLMESAHPGQREIQDKLKAVLKRLDEEEGPQPNAPETGARLATGTPALERRNRQEQMATQRSRDKKQFNEWIEGFRPEGKGPQ